MALTRKFLSALGIEADKVDEIIAAHTETVDALKEQRDTYKADAEQLPAVQKELDDLKKAAEELDGKNPYEVKYNALKEEFESFKEQQAAKETRAAKDNAFRNLLKEAGISEKRLEAVLRVSDVDSVELDETGAIKGADAMKESIRKEWSDFIVTESPKGAPTPTPPADPAPNYDDMSDAEYYKQTYEAKKYEAKKG